MFRARVFARTLLYVVFVTSTFFRWLFSNYVEDYLNATFEGSSLLASHMCCLRKRLKMI